MVPTVDKRRVALIVVIVKPTQGDLLPGVELSQVLYQVIYHFHVLVGEVGLEGFSFLILDPSLHSLVFFLYILSAILSTQCNPLVLIRYSIESF